MSKISIVIRSKNEQKWIAETLSRIRSQSLDAEILLVDNNSTDDTVEIAKGFQLDHILNIDEFLPGKAINLGVRKSSGDYIVCISAHCLPTDQRWLEKLLESLNFTDKNKTTNIVAAYGRQLPLKSTSELNKRDLFNTFGLDNRIQFKDFFFHNANSIIKKNYLEEFPFSNTLTNVEDRVWAKQVIDSGLQIGYSADATVYHFHGLNHGNESGRLKRVNTIIEPLYKPTYNSNSELSTNILQSQHKFNVIFMTKQEIDLEKINALSFELQKIPDYNAGFFIVQNVVDQVVLNDRVRYVNRSGFNNIDKIGLFQFIKEFYDSNTQDFKGIDYLLFLSEKSLNNLNNIEALWEKTKEDFLDFSFMGKQIYKNFWTQKGSNLEPVFDEIYLREFSTPIFDVSYGMGLFISVDRLRSSDIFGGINGLYEI